MRRKKRALKTFVGFVVIALFMVAAGIAASSMPGKENASDEASAKVSTSLLEIPEKAEEEDTDSSEESLLAECDTVIVDYIDVGQGDATLIYDETTRYSVMIDTGLYEAYDNVQTALSEYGIDTLDALILTHPDADHIQSAVDVIRDYNVPAVYMSKATSDTKTYEYLMGYLGGRYSGGIYYPIPGDGITLGSAKLIFLGPAEYIDYTDTNGNSLITKLVNGNDSFLFLGDATGDEVESVLSKGADMSADVLKASHHGSANDGCNSERLFNAAGAESLVVSCGYGNDHGHPHIETMELAKKYGLNLFRTDLQGSVSCISSGEGISWNKASTTVYTNGNGF